MKKVIISVVAAACLLGARTGAQSPTTPVNAALRYWMAFAVMKDPPDARNGITLELMDRIAAGTAPIDDRIIRVLDENREALEIMRRASALPSCDWGLEYELGSLTPIAHLAKGRVLGRLNVLAGQRLAASNQWGQAVDAWIAGVRFSQHLAQGGSLIAALSARSILRPALNAVVKAMAQPSLDAAHRTQIAAVVRALPDAEFDWDAAMKREEESVAIYRHQHPGAKTEMANPVKVNATKEEARAERKQALAAVTR
jgi:hypothetical protein